MNVYECCPTVSDEKYVIRLVQEADCADLLQVYSDERAIPLFNSDNCHGDDFHYRTLARMMQGIHMWMNSYRASAFVRWSIVDRKEGCAIGTIEMFRREAEDEYNDCIILRLDLRSDYESAKEIEMILALIVPPSFSWFNCERMATKAKEFARERIEALRRMGFEKSSEKLIGHDGTEYGDYYVLRAVQPGNSMDRNTAQQ